MLRQVIKYRTQESLCTVQMQMKMRRIAEEYGKRDESGKLIHPLRQSDFERFMKHADKVAKRWL